MDFSNELSLFDVQKWIKDLFDNEIDIPEFKENSESMKLISKIICLNREGDKDVKETIKTDLKLTDYYTKRNEEICTSFIQHSIADLSPKSIESVEKISSLAIQMKLKEPSITNFLLCSTFLEIEKEYYSEEQIIRFYNLSKFSKKITNSLLKNNILNRKVEKLEKIVNKQRPISTELPERCKFMRIKIEEYKKQIKRMEKQLSKHGWTSSLSHGELVKKADAIQCLEKEVNLIAAKLNSYQDLPPNEMLANLKIEEAQAKLVFLRQEFENILKESS